ncbi:MAG TPA: hypothetical protein VFA94_16115 [Acidimicrobiales bacterium]|nr:hypothetical protein [Acidimicrobiales bacterium]
MRKILARLGVFAAVLSTVAMLVPSSAYGASQVAAGGVGHGTISPGLTTTPTAQSVSFQSDVFIGGGVSTDPNAATGTVNCTFNGSSTLPGGETVAQGGGSVTGSCTVAAGVGVGQSVNCTVSYSRVGNVVVITVNCTFGTHHSTGGGVFLFVPTSVNPTTSYELVGTAAAVGTD